MIYCCIHSPQVLWKTWPDLTTGFQTRRSPSVTSAPKPSLRSCPSTTAGPADRVCVDLAPHTPGPCLPEAGTTQSECVTAATHAQTLCNPYNHQNFSRSAPSLPLMRNKHCESWHCCSEETTGIDSTQWDDDRWNRPCFCEKTITWSPGHHHSAYQFICLLWFCIG